MAATITPPPSPDLYLTFCSGIDQASVQRVMLAIDIATQKSVERIHMLFQSTGGSVGDGICLYNFFKSLPVELNLYNVGSVQSIAALCYLGAKRRVVSTSAVFTFHRTAVSPQFAMAFALKNFAETVGIDDRRTEENLACSYQDGAGKVGPS
jgi:ATP-dependent protease ClpP protease subunit